MRDRLIELSDALRKAATARATAQGSAWAEAWERLESELLERALEADEDAGRFRLLEAIKACRRVRRIVEHEGATVESLQRELDLLEGKRPRAIA